MKQKNLITVIINLIEVTWGCDFGKHCTRNVPVMNRWFIYVWRNGVFGFYALLAWWHNQNLVYLQQEGLDVCLPKRERVNCDLLLTRQVCAQMFGLHLNAWHHITQNMMTSSVQRLFQRGNLDLPNKWAYHSDIFCFFHAKERSSSLCLLEDFLVVVITLTITHTLWLFARWPATRL